VKIARADDKFIFQLRTRENLIFSALLKLYPANPEAGRTGSAATPDSSQHLLEEALREQRIQNKRKIQEFLSEPRRFEQTETGCKFFLTPAELEWLLQILNDIRVGSWVSLGSPDEIMDLKLLNERTAPHFWAMETAGQFEMHMLRALNG
jgi:hypothetical protein